jgi:hypothetical protein
MTDRADAALTTTAPDDSKTTTMMTRSEYRRFMDARARVVTANAETQTDDAPVPTVQTTAPVATPDAQTVPAAPKRVVPPQIVTRSQEGPAQPKRISIVMTSLTKPSVQRAGARRRGGGGRPMKSAAGDVLGRIISSIVNSKRPLTAKSDAKDESATDGSSEEGGSSSGEEDDDDTDGSTAAESDNSGSDGSDSESESEDDKTDRKRKRESWIKKGDNPELDSYDDEEYKYYKTIDSAKRQTIDAAERVVTTINYSATPQRFKILESFMDDNLKALAISKMQTLYQMEPSSSEYFKLTKWMDALCRLPIGRIKKLPVTHESPVAEISAFLKKTKDTLDEVAYGHVEAKDQIVRLLAQRISNPDSHGLVIGIEGPMGCGKTTLVKQGVCRALDLPFAFVPLGGASDGAFLDGHGYVYEGSSWGKIVDVLMKCGYANPIFYFDELDKISQTAKGAEVTNILIHLTDTSQNNCFQDKYFQDVEFDVSKSVIIFSFNDESKINPILKDRMIHIKTKGYTVAEKVTIAQKHLVPGILKQFNFAGSDVVFEHDLIRTMIATDVEEEQGVRNLKRALESVISNLNLHRLLHTDLDGKACEGGMQLPIAVTEAMVRKFVAKQKKNASLAAMYM